MREPGHTTEPPTAEEQLRSLFGSYKAEWLSEQLFDLFTEPGYWPELADPRPCVLIGGRGTGKTTVLRLLSYEGQYALRGRGAKAAHQMPFIGFYNRVDTNRVRAFSGPEVEEHTWIRIFGHYLNLSMVLQVLTFADWYRTHVDDELLLASAACLEVAASLNLDRAATQSELRDATSAALVRLEAEVNNVGERVPTQLSMQKAPVDRLLEHLRLRLPHKQFFFLFDEYENFTDYQQRVLNTFIKHSGETYSFKIGVRELGFANRATLNPTEQLISPSDYSRINITETFSGDQFKRFAAQVCNNRLARVGVPDARGLPDISALLPGLSENEEAALLGASEVVESALAQDGQLTRAELDDFQSAPLVAQLVVTRLTAHHGHDLAEQVRDFLSNREAWKARVNNYGYACLFTLQRGRGRGGVQKYYAGWDVYSGLAAGNIRYVLELVEQAVLLHLRSDAGAMIGEAITPRVQTLAAQAVGRKNLTELEGLSVHGAQLTRLVLGLGRVFQLLAVDPLGHTPEVNEFELADPGEPDEDLTVAKSVTELIRSAVMHLALIRYPGSRVSTEESDTRDYDFRLHPIFSPAFVFSHRRKRKLALSSSQVVELVSEPRSAIPSILRRHNRAVDEPLPDQLQLFAAYFGDK